MGQLRNFIKSFSAVSSTNVSSYLSSLPIKSNVIRRNNTNTFSVFGGVGSSVIKTPSNEISDYLNIVQEHEQFRYLDFTENVLKILSTDIVNLIDDDRNICTVGDAKKDEILEKEFKSLDLRRRIRESIPEEIYYGSISYLTKSLKVNNETKLFLYDLEHPYSVIQREVGGKRTYILQGSVDLEVDESAIVYIGSADFKLKAPDSEYEIVNHDAEKELCIKASKATYYASRPLFYALIHKIKEYFIKELLSTILSLRDAIQPTLLTFNEEITRNGGDASMFNNAATNLESLINRTSDQSITIAEILSIDTLVNSAFSSIRVLPDPGGSLQGLSALNLDEIKDKLNRLKDGINDLKDAILDSLGIPPDLWNGSTNSNEVFQKNERLQSTVYNQLKATKISVRRFLYCVITALHPNWNIKEEDIKVTLFRKSQVEYSRNQREISSLKETLSLISDTLAAASEVIENNRFVDKKSYYGMISDNMNNISPDIGKLILPIDKALAEDPDESMNEEY